MKKSLTLVIVMFFTAVATAAAEDVGEGIKRDASEAKQGVQRTTREFKHDVKTGAHEFWQSVRAGAVTVKRQVAVAQCNDGEYSYTHHTTCNHHGGVRQQLR
jgi:hypothetical protein